jgi:N-methylhydantoinase A
LRNAGEAALARDRLAGGRFDFAADLRYRGQEHTIAIVVTRAEDLASDTEGTRLRFDQQHDRRYGHAAPDQSIEIVNLRLVVTVPRMEDVIGRWCRRLGRRARPSSAASRVTTPSARSRRASPGRPALHAGTEVVGPAVTDEPNSTTFIGPGDRAVINEAGISS